MSNYIDEAKNYIENENFADALKLARKRHGKDDIKSYLTILDMLIDAEFLPAIEEKGLYYQYYDPSHDNGDYGEKYFDRYLEKQPHSINALCDKAMSKFNKGQIDEALSYIDKAHEKYKSYSKIEKPRISKREVSMSRIELLIQSKRYDDALKDLTRYENNFGSDQKSDLYFGQMLQKNGENREAIDYLDKSLGEEATLLAFNSRGDAYYELKEYENALKDYEKCLNYESQIENDLDLKTNFNYKSAFCCVKLGKKDEAIKFLNKTINMLNEYGRLPKDLEAIYQKCSFEKERLLKTGVVEDKEFKKTRFLSTKTALIVLAVILILYVVLKLMGYG
ncbi:tetratricopeptide repeat protein [Methanobrevibacter sp.]|uniref:tetratricopeptide repeat protein n=1 Tax=Methanobrevibacter sp. TaxID=66852 RepID=UPI00388F4283